MTETAHFRTAVGGFHKGDVSEYIAKTAAAHQAELQEKDALIAEKERELQTLREKLSALEAAAMQAPAPEELPEPETAPPVPPAQGTGDTDFKDLELAAYRRAEALERLAGQRAGKLYEALGGICRDAQGQLGETVSAARESARVMASQAEALDAACRALTEALGGAQNQLRAMDAMIPDPAEGMEES